MRLERISLRNFRGVSEATVPFAPGLTVVAGPNEVGKSTLAEAWRLVRRFKATSRSREIAAVKPVDSDVGPEVEVALTTGPYRLTYRKRWLRSPVTELSVRGAQQEELTGEEAHERFDAILAETVDADLLAALDVAQGFSLDQPLLASVSALARALDGASGGEGQGVGHDALLERIEAAYLTYFTPRGTPTGEYRRLGERLVQAREAVAELSRRSRELDRLVEDHAAATERSVNLRAALQEARDELDVLEEKALALDTLRAAATRASERAEEIEQELARAAAALDARRQDVEEVAALQARHAERAARADERAAAVQLAASLAEEALKERNEAERRHELAHAAARAAARRAQRARDLATLQESSSRLERARELLERQRDAQARLEQAPLDDRVCTRLADLATEVRVAERSREGAAATVTVYASVDGVRLDGETVSPGADLSRAVLEPVMVTFPGQGRVQVDPAPTPASLEEAVRSARSAFAAALAEADVASVEEARVVSERARTARAEAEQAAEALALVLREDTPEELEAQVAALREALRSDSGAEELACAGDPVSDGPHEGPSNGPESVGAVLTWSDGAGERVVGQESERLAREAEREADAAMRRAGEARAVQQAAEAAHARAREEAVRASESLTSSREQRDHRLSRLEAARAERSDEELARAVQLAQDRATQAAAAAADASAALSAAEPELLEMELRNARELVSRRREQGEQTRTEVTRLHALIEDRTADGLYDRLAAARAELTDIAAEYRRTDRAARAARLLRETMQAARARAQERYVAPFRARIERLGRVVFGREVEVAISPELAITSRTLDGRTVPFASLSAGAREQLALLGRLACAQLVDPADGAPIMLDDALGFADPARLRALSVVLHEVGRTVQVIILTCQEERFAHLGGAEVVHLADAAS